MEDKKTTIKVENYGQVLAQVNDLKLVSFQEDGGYQGKYLAVLKGNGKIYYFIDSYGSCSGCDWLKDVGEYDGEGKYEIPFNIEI